MNDDGNIVLNINQNAGKNTKKLKTKKNKKSKVLKFQRQRDFNVKIKNSYVPNRPVLSTSDFVKRKENDKSQNSKDDRRPKSAFQGKQPKFGTFNQSMKDGMKPKPTFSGHPKESAQPKSFFSDRSKEEKQPKPGFSSHFQEKKPKTAFSAHPKEEKQLKPAFSGNFQEKRQKATFEVVKQSKPAHLDHSQEKKKIPEFSQQKKVLLATELKQTNENAEKKTATPFASFVKREKKSKFKKIDKKQADRVSSRDTTKPTRVLDAAAAAATARDDDDNSESSEGTRPSAMKSELKTKKVKRLQQSTAGNARFEPTNSKKGDFQHSRPSERGFQYRRDRPVKHFSSLFHNNPEIPEMHLKTMKQSKEQFFASEDFELLDIHPFIKSNIKQNLKLEKMTAIQQKAIPAVLTGRDVSIQSQTGSGKTLAYAIPLVHKLQAIQPEITRASGPVAIVLMPTRELAIQTMTTVQQLLRSFVRIVPGILIGGENRKKEKDRIRKGLNIIIATPGRLRDHIETTQSLDLSKIQFIILDEADRMLDLGFERDMTFIMKVVDAKSTLSKQKMLLSATLSPGLEKIISMNMTNDPVRIELDSRHAANASGDVYAIPEKLQHYFVVVPNKLRLVALSAFLLGKTKFENVKKMVIFLATNDAVEFHYVLLSNVLLQLGEENEEDSDVDDAGGASGRRQGATPQLYRLRGNMTQHERTSIFLEFVREKQGILLCTDVAARGLDIPAVKWIVQYNPPSSPTDYIHRVGRTARVGSHGSALLFVTPSETKYIDLLSKQNINFMEMKIDEILSTLMLESSNLTRRRDDKIIIPYTPEECATGLQSKFEEFTYASDECQKLAHEAYVSSTRAYATYPKELKDIFNVRALHLGHVAKSFCLLEAPSDIIGQERRSFMYKRKREDLWAQKKGSFKKSKLQQVSEFGSGL